jgi:hypothetical protein
MKWNGTDTEQLTLLAKREFKKTVAVKALGRMMVMEAMAMLSKESETVAR